MIKRESPMSYENGYEDGYAKKEAEVAAEITALRERVKLLAELLAVVSHYNYTPYDDVPYEMRQSEFYPQGGSTKKLREGIKAALKEGE